MPSNKNPNALSVGAGKLPANTVTATAQLFPSSRADVESVVDTTSRPVLLGDLSEYTSFTSSGDTSRFLSSALPHKWLGDTNSPSITDLFKVVTVADSLEESDPVVAEDGTTITVTGVTGASLGDGFVATNITVQFSGTIPSGVDYRVLWAAPQALSEIDDLSADALVRAGQMGALSKQNLTTAMTGGLDGHYRRSTAAVNQTTINLDTAGDGAVFTRDGQAVTASLPSTVSYLSNRVPDPFLAAFAAIPDDFSQTASDEEMGGDYGLVQFTGVRESSSDANELSSQGSNAGLGAVYIPRDIQDTTVNGGTVRTYVPKGVVATLNPSNAGGDILEISAPHYFALAGVTALSQSADVILVTFADNTQQAYRAGWYQGDPDNRVTLKTLGGATPSFAQDTPVTIQWFSCYLNLGQVNNRGSGLAAGLGPLFLQQPLKLRTGGSYAGIAPDVDLRSASIGSGEANSTPPTLLKTSYQQSDGNLWNGARLLADGSYVNDLGSFGQYVTRSAGGVTSVHIHRTLNGTGGSSNQEFTVNPLNEGNIGQIGGDGEGFGFIGFYPAGAPDTPITVTMTAQASDWPNGMEFKFLLRNLDGLDFTMAWDPEFKFSDPSDAQLGAANGSAGAGSEVLWEGIALNNVMYMKRTDY
jgi:hypothetical protein